MPYVTRPRADDMPGWMENYPLLPTLTVDGPKEVNTGLVDRFGHTIMRVQAPIGFGRDAEH